MDDLLTLAQSQYVGIFVFEEATDAARLGLLLQCHGFDVDLTPSTLAETGERVFLVHFRPHGLSLN